MGRFHIQIIVAFISNEKTQRTQRGMVCKYGSKVRDHRPENVTGYWLQEDVRKICCLEPWERMQGISCILPRSFSREPGQN